MSELSKRKCLPCKDKNLKPFTKEKAEEYLDFVPGWFLGQGSTLGIQKGRTFIHKEFLFADFVKAVEFVNQVADIAEVEGHHPDIHIFYNKVKLEIWTHSIGGLSENDFILAAKIDDMLPL